MRQANGRVLSRDFTGRWVLWDIASHTLVASGDPAVQSCTAPLTCYATAIDMAGDVFLVHVAGAVELRHASDGHLILSVPLEAPAGIDFPPFGLARDGSYLWVGSSANLRVWSADGTPRFTRTGNYRTGMFLDIGDPYDVYSTVPAKFVDAAPDQLRIGRKTSQTIEYLDSTSGASTTSAPFASTFLSWFDDGGQFLTYAGTSIRIYTKDAVQEAITVLPTLEKLEGYAGYFWTKNGVHQVANTAAPPQPFTGIPVPSGRLIAMLNSVGPALGAMAIMHLDAGGITLESLPSSVGLQSFAADAAGSWSVASGGAIFDKDRFLSGGAPLSCGWVTAIAGADAGLAAVGTDAGGVLTFDAQTAGATFQGALPYRGARLAVTADGSKLAVGDDAVYWSLSDQTIRLLAMPGASVIHQWPLAFDSQSSDTYDSMSLARSGTTLAYSARHDGVGVFLYTRKATDTTGTTIFTDQPSIPFYTSAKPTIVVSPNGTLVAASDPVGGSTQIYKNGTLVDFAAGNATGWLDDDRLLLDGKTIHSVTTATTVATVTLPCTLKGFNVVDAGHVYCPSTNSIYDLATSAAVWTGSVAPVIGAIAGKHVVYAPVASSVRDHRVYAEPYSLP